MRHFRNRSEGGRLLAKRLEEFRGRPDGLVLALPRGGVPVAFEIARALELPLDLIVVRKLGAPGNEEFAIGAIASDGTRFLNTALIQALELTAPEVDEIVAREQDEITRREAAYRPGRAPVNVKDKCVIVVDDGLATGATMMAAVRALRAHRPKTLTVAVPVAPLTTCEELRREVDDLRCLEMPEPFHGVGLWYYDFSQTSDEDVRRLLKEAEGMVASNVVGHGPVVPPGRSEIRESERHTASPALLEPDRAGEGYALAAPA